MLPTRQFARSLLVRRIPLVGTASLQQQSPFSTTSPLRRPNRDDIPSNNDPKDPTQPHLPNVVSTLTSDVPQVGKAPPPPEFLGSVDKNYNPVDGGSATAKEGEVSGAQRPGHGVKDASESDWAKFIAEPIKRVGEDEKTMRARLFYQSRKRGILETDLLLSTFADENLPSMSVAQMSEYDKFLDENDWDIYYWTTQEPPVNVDESTTTTPNPSALHSTTTTEETTYNTPSSRKTASEVHPDGKIQPPPGAIHVGSVEQPAFNVDLKSAEGDARAGGIEWAQTVGSTKVAYKPVPEKWKNSWVLGALRSHVENKKAGGDDDGTTVKGMGRMPDLKNV